MRQRFYSIGLGSHESTSNRPALRSRPSLASGTISFAIAMTACCASSSMADIASVGGDVVIQDPPSSIILGEWESDTEIRTWFESEVTLPADVTLGHVDSGFINDLSQHVTGDIASGTRVSSYMIRLDAIDIGPTFLSGSVTFDMPILGVWFGHQLDDFDALLGRPGVSYNDGYTARGVELQGNAGADSFDISADRLTISFTFGVIDWTDDIRVLTAVPAPSSVTLAGLAGLMAARRRR